MEWEVGNRSVRMFVSVSLSEEQKCLSWRSSLGSGNVCLFGTRGNEFIHVLQKDSDILVPYGLQRCRAL